MTKFSYTYDRESIHFTNLGRKFLHIPFEGIGGGLRVLEKFSLTSMNVIALNILFPKWAHFLLSSKRLPSSDASKMMLKLKFPQFSPKHMEDRLKLRSSFLQIASFWL